MPKLTQAGVSSRACVLITRHSEISAQAPTTKPSPRCPTKNLDSSGQEKSPTSISQTMLGKILEMAVCAFSSIFNEYLWNSYCMLGPSPVSGGSIVNKTDTSRALLLGHESPRLTSQTRFKTLARLDALLLGKAMFFPPTQSSPVPSAYHRFWLSPQESNLWILVSLSFLQM